MRTSFRPERSPLVLQSSPGSPACQTARGRAGLSGRRHAIRSRGALPPRREGSCPFRDRGGPARPVPRLSGDLVRPRGVRSGEENAAGRRPALGGDARARHGGAHDTRMPQMRGTDGPVQLRLDRRGKPPSRPLPGMRRLLARRGGTRRSPRPRPRPRPAPGGFRRRADPRLAPLGTLDPQDTWQLTGYPRQDSVTFTAASCRRSATPGRRPLAASCRSASSMPAAFLRIGGGIFSLRSKIPPPGFEPGTAGLEIRCSSG